VTCFEALDLPNSERDVVWPFAVQVGAGDLAFAVRHRRRVAVNLMTRTSLSFATLSIASRSSVASNGFRGSLLLPLRCPLGMGEERKI